MATASRRSWKRRSDARPAELRLAGLRLFARHGYGGTTIEDIAQAADTTVGTVYRYFRDKETLLHEIVDWTTTEPFLPAETEPLSLRRLAETIWTASRREPHVHVLRLLLAEGGNTPALVERYRAGVLEPIERALALALEADGRTTNGLATAQALLGGLLGASVLAGSPGAPTPLVPQLAPLDMTTATLLGGSHLETLRLTEPAPTHPQRPPSRSRTPDAW